MVRLIIGLLSANHMETILKLLREWQREIADGFWNVHYYYHSY